MNFKEEYKKEYNNIAPDPDFLHDLQQDLEHNSIKSSTHRLAFYQRIAVAAACIGIITACAVIFPRVLKRPADTADQEITHLGTTSEQPSLAPGVFNSGSWYSGKSSDSEIASFFCEKLNSENLTKLYHNQTNTFTQDDLLSSEDLDILLSLILEAGSPATIPSDYTPSDYYMACFDNGDIIKFTMNSEYLYLPDANIYLLIQD